MAISLSGKAVRAWLEAAVFALDRRLCRRYGVFEYWTHPQCLFRIQLTRLEDTLVLTDGTRVPAGSRVLALHLWNEHIPVMGRKGPTVGWARKINRAMHTSLRELARHLATQSDFEDIAAICGDMRVSSAGQARRLARTLARYGFEPTVVGVDRRGLLHRIGDAVFILMLVLVTNPATLRGAALRYGSVRVLLSRTVLEARYAATSRTSARSSSRSMQQAGAAASASLASAPVAAESPAPAAKPAVHDAAETSASRLHPTNP